MKESQYVDVRKQCHPCSASPSSSSATSNGLAATRIDHSQQGSYSFDYYLGKYILRKVYILFSITDTFKF